MTIPVQEGQGRKRTVRACNPYAVRRNQINKQKRKLAANRPHSFKINHGLTGRNSVTMKYVFFEKFTLLRPAYSITSDRTLTGGTKEAMEDTIKREEFYYQIKKIGFSHVVGGIGWCKINGIRFQFNKTYPEKIWMEVDHAGANMFSKAVSEWMQRG